MDYIKKIDTIYDLKNVLIEFSSIKLYGAGFYLDMFLHEIDRLNIELLGEKVKCIFVSNKAGNDNHRGKIPIIPFDEAMVERCDAVILTLGAGYVEEVYSRLETTGATIFCLDFNMFQEKTYSDIKDSIQPFINDFPDHVSGLNLPDKNFKDVIAWGLWWQGIEDAPEIVKTCFLSQKRNLPPTVKQIIITKNNYKDYFSVPEYIIEKMEQKKISITTFSDIVRASLLYRYGVFWLDSTVLVLKSLDKKIMDYPIYTRNLPGTQYCTKAMWADWFLYAKQGHILFQFLMEAFFFYYSVFNHTKNYYLVDYLIAIACNQFIEVEKHLQQIPHNNFRAMELERHLMEEYNEQAYQIYIQGTSIQKLTYKLNWENKKIENSVYQKILKNN